MNCEILLVFYLYDVPTLDPVTSRQYESISVKSEQTLRLKVKGLNDITNFQSFIILQ